MASSPAANFVTIPVELRLQIYKIVLDRAYGYYTKSYLSISLVNHQIRDEILPILYHQEKYFGNLAILSSWVSQGKDLNKDLLKLVENISLQLPPLHSFDLSTEETNEPSNPIMEEIETWWEEQYLNLHLEDSETFTWIKQIQPKSSKSTRTFITTTLQTFQSLPSLKTLWITFLAYGTLRGTPTLSTTINTLNQHLFLHLLSTTCPTLTSLTLFSTPIPLNFLANLPLLQKLRFTGYSQTSPSALLTILNSLAHLTSICLIREHNSSHLRHRYGEFELGDYVSFTPFVLSTLTTLTQLQIHHEESYFPSHFITEEMFMVLKQHTNLQQLSLIHRGVLSRDVFKALMEVLLKVEPGKLRLDLGVCRESREEWEEVLEGLKGFKVYWRARVEPPVFRIMSPQPPTPRVYDLSVRKGRCRY